MAGYLSFSWLSNCVYVLYLFIHLSIDGYAGCFQSLAIVSNATVNTIVYVAHQNPVFVSKSCFSCIRYCQSDTQNLHLQQLFQKGRCRANSQSALLYKRKGKQHKSKKGCSNPALHVKQNTSAEVAEVWRK